MPGQLPKLTGPVHNPHAGGAPKKLVVLVHGFGADGNDLIGLAPVWAPLIPDAVFVSPDAPYACEGAPFGRQWFSLTERTPQNILAGARSSGPILDAFLDETLATYGLSDDKLAIVGFSQGTMMALYTALRRPKAAAGVLGYSGVLVGADLLASEIRCRPPVLLMHGDADPVVPPAALAAAVKTLKAAGVTVTDIMRPGMGHAIDEECLRRGGEFLRANLNRQA
jgi:phospholipase/carboxylesterase